MNQDEKDFKEMEGDGMMIDTELEIEEK